MTTRRKRGLPMATDGLLEMLEEVRAKLAPRMLNALTSAFALSAFEQHLLVLCAGVELDARIRARCAAVNADPRLPHATFGLGLAALPDAHWSALAPGGPLRLWHLLEVGPGDILTLAPLRIDERVMHYLLGVAATDYRLTCIMRPVTPPRELPPSHLQLATQLAEVIAFGQGTPILQLGGGDRAGRAAVAAAATTAIGMPLHRLNANEIASVPADRELVSRLCEREGLLTGAALLVETEAADASAFAFVEGIGGIVFVDRSEPLTTFSREVLRFELPATTAAEQHRLWVAALGEVAGSLNGQVEQVAEHFQLGPRAIHAAAAATVRAIEGGAAPGDVLWDACRAEARPRLSDLTQRVEPRATWDAMVLPAATLQTLRTIVAQVRQRARVYRDWGFADLGPRGLGVSALFSGPSGTGKTMAAEVLAAELHLDLHRIDLSSLVSKYIGETEKNLRRVFDAAEEGGAILLFDEADALFGRRSEVKDSHDRYANVEVSYLLQRIECYRGLAILTTNMRNALDPAFLRRIRFVVQFPFPDAAQRAEIWRRIYPAELPIDGLDIGKLARLALPGGSIRNLALNAAFLAADAGEPVRMHHLLAAATGEYAKLDRALSEADTEGWL